MRMLQPRVRPAKQGLALLMKRADPFYLSAEWKETRARVLERDGHRCTIPGCDRRRVHRLTTSSAARLAAQTTIATCDRCAVPTTIASKRITSASGEGKAEAYRPRGGLAATETALAPIRQPPHARKFWAGTKINGSFKMGHKRPVGRFFSPRPLVHRDSA